jgi:hypothetical protein
MQSDRQVSRSLKAKLHRQRQQAIARRKKHVPSGVKTMGFFVNRPSLNRDTAPERADEFSDAELELILALGKIERYQAHINEAYHDLKELLNDDPKLATIWKKFEANGGTCVDQLKQFLRGTMRPRIVTKRGGLRLISDRPEAKKFVTYRRLNDDGDSGPDNAA